MSHHIFARSPFVSIIIPAKNEVRRLPASLEKIARYLSGKLWPAEIIIVDNGSTDGTGDLVRQFAESHVWLPVRLIEERSPGKGAAVRTGMFQGTGEILFQCDADLSMPIEELDKLIAGLGINGDLAIGCREGICSNRQGEGLHRRLMGRAFNKLVRALDLSALPDTQCGFKVFRRSAAYNLFASQTITGWGFDVEILVLARHLGYSISTVPIQWIHDTDSRVRPVHDGIAMLRDVWTIRRRLHHGDYGQAFEHARVCTNEPNEKIRQT